MKARPGRDATVRLTITHNWSEDDKSLRRAWKLAGWSGVALDVYERDLVKKYTFEWPGIGVADVPKKVGERPPGTHLRILSKHDDDDPRVTKAWVCRWYLGSPRACRTSWPHPRGGSSNRNPTTP
jgi:hypothetical protein